MEQVLSLDQIKVGERCRRDVGDIEALASSIERLGLLHAVVVTDGNLLVAGFRRLEAVRRLGWESVAVRVVAGLDEALLLLQAERDENTCRKDFTMSEAVEMKRRLEELERPKAKARQQELGRTHGTPSAKFAEGVGRTRDKVSEAVGYSHETLRKAEEVVEAAEEDPELFTDVAEEMDRTGKVDPAYQEVKRRRDPKPAPPPPKHPHSARLLSWLHAVSGETHVVNVELGGIQAMLDEPAKWDRREVREYIVPMLEALEKTIREFHQEIRHAFK